MENKDYPSNSHASRNKEQKEVVESVEKNVEEKKVIKGSVKVKKKSPILLFANKLGIIPDDIEDVKSYIIHEQLIPSFKVLLSDVIQTLIFGESGYRGRGGPRRNGDIAYNRAFDNKNYSNSYQRPSGSAFAYDDLSFESKFDAERVLSALQSDMERYGLVRLADLYEYAGTTCPYTYMRFGWDIPDDVMRARVQRERIGYVITLPSPVDISRR